MSGDRTRLRLDQIMVPADRLRKVDDATASIIGRSISATGQHQPITVRPTPAAERPYTLVDGENRYRGSQLNGLVEIDVIVRKLNPAQARLVEIEANLIRDELDKLERAQAVAEYRRLWEQENGEIRRGNPAFANSVNLTELVGGFFDHAQETLGLSRSAIERSQFIVEKLQADVAAQIANSPVADNQSLLISLAKATPDRQRRAAQSYAEGGDIKIALAEAGLAAKPAAPVRDPQQDILDALISGWDRATAATRKKFAQHAGLSAKASREKLPTLGELMAEAEAVADRPQSSGGGMISDPLNDPRQVTIFDLLGAAS